MVGHRGPARHYRGVRLGSRVQPFYVRTVNLYDAETLDEMLADAAAMPVSLRATDQALPLPRAAKPWEVDDACYAQVRDIDEYV